MNNYGGWFGYNDITTEGTWIWADGTPSGYSNWQPGEPNGNTNENCGELSNSGTWNDLPCTTFLGWFVCNHPS